jgi:SPP1 family predicted phage head-tail adaptor
MNIGELDKRVLIQSPTGGTTDEYGETITGWADVFSGGDHKIWASVVPLLARELIAAKAAQSAMSHRVTVRYRPEFANPLACAGWRILYGVRVFNITGALDTKEARIEVVLLCTEGLNLG